MNTVIGPMSQNVIEIKTGLSSPSNENQYNSPGTYKSINGLNHNFYFNKLFTGTTPGSWVTIPWWDNAINEQLIDFSTSNTDGLITNNM